jgi:hypothetical protein
MHRRQVRVVVLHADGGHAQRVGGGDGQLRAEEIGVQVVRDRLHRCTRASAWRSSACTEAPAPRRPPGR